MGRLNECAWFSASAVWVKTGSPIESFRLARFLSSALPNATSRAGIGYVLIEPNESDPDLLDAVESLLTEGASIGSGDDDVIDVRAHVLDVTYDGGDLVTVAEQLGLSLEGVSQLHCATVWKVVMLGFSPGFGYLAPVTGDDSVWSRVERLATPRRSVPMGSVAVAGGMSCVYPATMPGGWPIIGSTRTVLFDPASEDAPTLLRPGDHVRFNRMNRQQVRCVST